MTVEFLDYSRFNEILFEEEEANLAEEEEKEEVLVLLLLYLNKRPRRGPIYRRRCIL